jgi:xanthine/uracil permease
VPSYLGSSFAFIGPVLAATGAAVAAGPNANIGLALGGIIAAGALYSLIGLIVMAAGHHWVEKVMPPVVTGAIVAAIGLVLAPIAISSASGIGPGNADGSSFARWIALITVVAVGLFAVYAPGLARRIPILLGASSATSSTSSRRTRWGSARRSTSPRSAPPRGSACRISPRRCSTARRWC